MRGTALPSRFSSVSPLVLIPPNTPISYSASSGVALRRHAEASRSRPALTVQRISQRFMCSALSKASFLRSSLRNTSCMMSSALSLFFTQLSATR